MLGLEAGPVGLPRSEGMPWPAQHGSGGAAIAQALVTGTGRAWVNNRTGSERIRHATLPPDASSVAGGLVDLLQSSEVHNVVVAVWGQVSCGLPCLVAVLQQDGGSNLICRPPSFIIGPVPKNPAAQSRGLREQGSPHSPYRSYKGLKKKIHSNWHKIIIIPKKTFTHFSTTTKCFSSKTNVKRAVFKSQNMLCIRSESVSLFPDIFVTSFLFFSIETTGVESHSNIPKNKSNLQLTDPMLFTYIYIAYVSYCSTTQLYPEGLMTCYQW